MDAAPSFVGSERCASCHQREHAAWRGTQHARALQPAGEATVLGNFRNASFDKDGDTTTFMRRDGKFLIGTTGQDGARADFEVKFTLGVSPLQQYLVELPGGRLQAFGIAWDSRPANAGGQRWLDLYPDQKLQPGDPIHWTGIQQTANFMCIDCHVTNLRKGYDAAAGVYHSTWSEAGVGCEACHGPGGAHVAEPRVKLPAQFPPRSRIVWGSNAAERPAVPTDGRGEELQVCARCHARRSQLTDNIQAGQPFADGFHGTLLDRGIYRSDGQMQDEVFNYGSFLQSRMFAKGVSCSDCHDPHTQKLRAEGNALCDQCHAPAKYESRAHHFHDPASKAGQCTSCHMPTVTYMIVDPRHDHSFRVPRPDLTASLDVPNACSSCHADKTAGWLASELRTRLGREPSGFQTFAEAFAAADRGAPGSASMLARIANDGEQPAWVRASAIARSFGVDRGQAGLDLVRALADPNPLVRTAAVEGVQDLDVVPLLTHLLPLLRDPARVVRIAAARSLAGPVEMRLGEADRASFRMALDEYVSVQRYNADRAEAHVNLALLEVRRGNGLLADEHLTRALNVDSTFVPAWLQLADLYRNRGDETRANETLRRGLQRNPGTASLHHALGLSLVRQRKPDAAREELRRASELAPEVARYGYVYAVALQQAGEQSEAQRVLGDVLGQHPYEVDSLTAAAVWAIKRDDRRAAIGYLTTLKLLRPNDRGIDRELLRLAQPPR
jgi:predicted CXXCH cytochrome family protein